MKAPATPSAELRCLTNGLLIALAAALQSASAQSVPAARPNRLESAESMKAIRAAIGEARCRADSDCRTAGVGVLACGGPEAYLAWSTHDADQAALKAAIERHAAQRTQEIARTGESSICQVLEDPKAACVVDRSSGSGHCRLNPRGLGGDRM